MFKTFIHIMKSYQHHLTITMEVKHHNRNRVFSMFLDSKYSSKMILHNRTGEYLRFLAISQIAELAPVLSLSSSCALRNSLNASFLWLGLFILPDIFLICFCHCCAATDLSTASFSSGNSSTSRRTHGRKSNSMRSISSTTRL